MYKSRNSKVSKGRHTQFIGFKPPFDIRRIINGFVAFPAVSAHVDDEKPVVGITHCHKNQAEEALIVVENRA